MINSKNLFFYPIITVGILDWLTTTISILFYGATETNPLLFGLTHSSMLLFSAVKLSAVILAATAFYKAASITQTFETNRHTPKLLNITYALTIFTLTLVVTNNITTIIKP